MKVIVAGSPKTGTKSLNAALTELGYSVYDYMEHFMCHYDEWINIFEGRGKIDDFKTMYKDVDAVVDAPSHLFWNEIHQAFPDAKIILTVRNEEDWFVSLKNQWKLFDKQHNSWYGLYTLKTLPIVRRFFDFHKRFETDLTGIPFHVGILSSSFPINKMLAIQNYRKRNAFVMQAAPKDKLLVFNVEQGWEPLCKFLNKDVPAKPFPHKNKAGKDVLVEPLKMKYGKQLRKEFRISIVIFILLFVFLLFSLRHYTIQTQAMTVMCIIVGLIMIL